MQLVSAEGLHKQLGSQHVPNNLGINSYEHNLI